MTMKKCANCDTPLIEGHMLDYFSKYLYYCDEKCLREDNPDLKHMSMQELYDEEIQYYTTWHEED